MTTDKPEAAHLADARTEFEAWITAPPYEKPVTINPDSSAWPGQYRAYEVQLAWEAYQAGRAESALLRAAIRRLCNIYVVDDYYMGQLREERLEEAVNRAIEQVKETTMKTNKPDATQLVGDVKYDTALFCDLKTDEEKSTFFLSGRGYETGVIAQAIQNDVAMAYHRCSEYRKELEAQRDECEKLRKDAARYQSLLEAVLREIPHRKGNRGNAPGHAHSVPGIWDEDNGALAGKECAWCKVWNEAVSAMQGAKP